MNEIGDMPVEPLGQGLKSSGAASTAERGQDAGLTLAVAMGLFGFALGEISGFSVMQGISQLLLSSVFTFVGGVLLSYAGFRRALRGRRDDQSPDPVRVGVALGCFSLGLCLGVGAPSGVYLRCNSRVQAWFLGESDVGISTCAQQEPKADSLAIQRLRVEDATAVVKPSTAPGQSTDGVDSPRIAESKGIGLQSNTTPQDRAFHALEEVSEPGRPAPKTGRLVIFDTGTGRFVKALEEPRIIGLFYHGMSPTGVALFQDSERDELINLGMTFPAEPVVVSPLAEFAGNPAFFADR